MHVWTVKYRPDLSSNEIILFVSGSYKMARIGEVLASDADIGLNSEVKVLLTCYVQLSANIHI